MICGRVDLPRTEMLKVTVGKARCHMVEDQGQAAIQHLFPHKVETWTQTIKQANTEEGT